MKTLILLALSLISVQAMAAGTCDLSENNEAVQAVNQSFDRGEMRGEDHVLALKELYSERLDMIADCVDEDETKGISRQELKDTLIHLEDEITEFVEEMNEAIRTSIENDRIGMASELTKERDEYVKELRTIQKKIKKLLK